MTFDPILFDGVAEHHNAFDVLLHDHCPEVVAGRLERALSADEAVLAERADPVGVDVASAVESHSIDFRADHISVAVALQVPAIGIGKIRHAYKLKTTPKPTV